MRFETKRWLKIAAILLSVMALWTTALYLGHPEYFRGKPEPAPVEDTDVFQNMRGE